jgi:hypothetical protein
MDRQRGTMARPDGPIRSGVDGRPALPEDLVHLITGGRNASVADGAQRALGCPSQDSADYARATAATGAWDVALR